MGTRRKIAGLGQYCVVLWHFSNQISLYPSIFLPRPRLKSADVSFTGGTDLQAGPRRLTYWTPRWPGLWCGLWRGTLQQHGMWHGTSGVLWQSLWAWLGCNSVHGLRPVAQPLAYTLRDRSLCLAHTWTCLLIFRQLRSSSTQSSTFSGFPRA